MFGWLKKRKKEDAKVELVAKSIEQAPKEMSTAKAISHTREPHPEWEKLFDSVDPTTELHPIRQRIHCEKRKYLVGHKKVVIYLEDKYNPEVNAFIAKYYDEITHKFERIGFTFIYAPKELEKIANEYATPTCDVEWNAETLLDLFHCRIQKPIGSAIVLIDETLNYRYAFPEQYIISTLIGVQLDAGTEEGLMAIFKAYWNQLKNDYCTPPCRESYPQMDIKCEDACINSTISLFDEEHRSQIAAEMETMYYGGPSQRDEELRLKRERKIREAEERKCKMSAEREEQTKGFFSGIVKKLKSVSDDLEKFPQDFVYDEVEECKCVRDQELVYPAKPDTFFEKLETLSEEDEQLLREIQELIERLHHSGIRQQLIEQMVRMTVKPSVLQVTDDARLLLTNYDKEVKMLPIDKLVYIFFLRHPEGVALKELGDHKEELINIYTRIQGRQLTQNQLASIGRLCNPLDNSINEKLSRIKQAFRAVAHDSVANCYIVQGERGELRNITLNEELIELGVWGR